MFKLRKKSGQARRKSPPQTRAAFEWRKSYNWIFLLLPLAYGAYYLSQQPQLMPIRTIQLSGSFENLDQGEVENFLQSYIGRGFFSLNIYELQRDLNARPWTESVSVRRIWPDKIRVTIVEKEPVARWDGEHLLSSSARVFRADTGAFAHLPLVYSAALRPDRVMQRFYRLQSRFEAVDERLVAIRVDSRGAIDVELINGLQIKLGRQDIERKVERLIRIYQQQILPRREQIQRLDLRYSNGFAVAWKAEALERNEAASIWSNSNV